MSSPKLTRSPWRNVLIAGAVMLSACSGGRSTRAERATRGLPLMPWPAHVTLGTSRSANGTTAGDASTPAPSDPRDPELQRLARLAGDLGGRRLHLGLQPGTSGSARSFPHRDESYRLIVSDSAVEISAATHAGVFYGIQTLRQLAAAGPLADLTIEDAPRFGYRGMHLDVVRHMMPTEAIERLIDEMARLKLNAFHWHLTDDQGWRIPIDAYPRLTEVGGRRAETVVGRQLDPYVGDGQPYGGFYTKDEIREIVRYASERYVTIIPEIEMPGHATAALAAYPEFSCTGGPIEVGTTWGVFEDIFCPTEATFRFLETVLDEVMALFPGPYVHVGGDEVPKTRWEESEVAQAVMRREGLADEEALQGWFMTRIERYVNAHGRTMIGWDEILEGGVPARAAIMSWRGPDATVAAARAGHDVVVAPNANLYFDHYQGDPAHEPLAIGGFTSLMQVYDFEPVPDSLTGDDARHVLGPQANVWTEYMPDEAQVEYMVFPRLLALSEVAWTPRALRDSTSFLRRLPARLEALDARGIGYRVPPPTGLDEDVPTLENAVTVRLGGLPFGTIRYTLDGSDPDPGDPAYERPLRVEATRAGTVVSARRFSPGGRASPLRRAVVRRVEPLPAVPGPATADAGLELAYFETSAAEVADLNGAEPSRRVIRTNVGIPGFARDEYFGLSFTGWIEVPVTGVYRFALRSDDGSTLSIDGRLVVDHDGYHGATERTGAVALSAGRHAFRLRYFQASGGRILQLGVRGPDGHDGPLPPAWLLHDAGRP